MKKNIYLLSGLVACLIILTAVLSSTGASAATTQTCSTDQVLIDGKCVKLDTWPCSSGYNYYNGSCTTVAAAAATATTSSSTSGSASSTSEESSSSGDVCTDIEAAYKSLTNQQAIAEINLAGAKANLNLYNATYQQAILTNPSAVTNISNIDYSVCVYNNNNISCGGNGENDTNCSNLSSKCDQLDVLVVSTNQTACLINEQAKLLKKAAETILNATSTGFTVTATSTATSTATATTTSTSTKNTTGTTNTTVFPTITPATSTSTTSTAAATSTSSTAALSLSLKPSAVIPGGSTTISVTVGSSAIKTYSISILKDGKTVSSPMSNITINGSTRPTTISHTLEISTKIPAGTYSIKATNDSNLAQSASANLTVTNDAAAAASMSSNFSSSSSCTNITSSIQLGSKGSNVVLLQDFLRARGYLNYPSSTGYFGSLTKSAVIRFQSENGISAIGIVGPQTRAKIKALTC